MLRCIMHLGQQRGTVLNSPCINKTRVRINGHRVTHVTRHMTQRVSALQKGEEWDTRTPHNPHTRSMAHIGTRTVTIHHRQNPRWRMESAACYTACQMNQTNKANVRRTRRTRRRKYIGQVYTQTNNWKPCTWHVYGRSTIIR